MAIALASVPTLAKAETCPEEVALLRAHLEVEQRRTKRWNTAWTIVYGSVAALQYTVAFAKYNPGGDFDDEFRDSMLVGATKATLGFGLRVVAPLRVRPPAKEFWSSDCNSELALLRAALEDGGKRERRSFYFGHLGGLAVNLAGAGTLWYRHDLKTAALSFGSGIAASILAAYTQPRRSWHLWRDRKTAWTATVGIAPIGDGGWGAGLGGTW